ncbi:hypothetical protein H2198_002579 [Neophaeococcomyces mojaviensis]|uniref:Uncharacterized protein n=1 Tax=Neophaeococcomyces mojaviensis TaxID=3383035 RepID=A0ACC3AEU1_9EURO|nr:hypothetical protein H2198_002579 [Knufia sp. JES_112]
MPAIVPALRLRLFDTSMVGDDDPVVLDELCVLEDASEVLADDCVDSDDEADEEVEVVGNLVDDEDGPEDRAPVD